MSPRDAVAFQIETATTSGCHEGITLEALARVGWPDGREPPPLDDTGERIADDVPFDLPDEVRDLWTIALLIGVRHNDVRANDPFDLPSLSVLHGDPDLQPEHCLRQPEHDGEPGDELALNACRRFVLEQIEAALGAGQGDELDLDALMEVETHLKFRGRIELDLPIYAFQVGRALHALQDSYTHTFRDHDTEEVLSVLNWVEGNLDGQSQLARDGHPHLTALDECGSGVGNQRRRDWAVAASADLLAALVSGDGGQAGRLDRARTAFDNHTRRQPGCTADNDWCDTPDADPAAGCSAGGASIGIGWQLALFALVALGAATRRRMRRSRRAMAILVAAALFTPAVAGAQPEDEPGGDEASDQAQADERAQEREEAKAERSDTATEQTLEREDRVLQRLPDPVSETWGAALNLGAAFDRGAGAVSLGVRWNPWRDLGFGLDAEYNPWVSVSGFDVAAGAASLYVPVTWRIKRIGTWELRTTAYAGASMILFDLVGVDRGTVGAFAGLNPLGLAFALGPHAKLVVKPGDLVVSAPQLRGIPFYYHQYRVTIGVEWYP